MFADSKISDLPELLIKKIHQCTVLFDFEDSLCDLRSKDIKRSSLLELHDYVKSNNAISEAALVDIIKMFMANAFRVLPPPSRINGADFDPEEDDPILEPSWPHLQLVYDLFGIFLDSPSFQPSFAKKFMDQSFVVRLLDLFESEDPRERDLLKTILHRVYGKVWDTHFTHNHSSLSKLCTYSVLIRC